MLLGPLSTSTDADQYLIVGGITTRLKNFSFSSFYVPV